MGEKYEVLVAGSGPAGMAAAVAAVRMGVKVGLVEKNGILGGNITSGHVGPIMGATDRGTLTEELCDLVGIGSRFVMHDIEQAKRVLPRWVTDAGVDVLLQVQVVDAILEDSRLTGLVVADKEGLRNIFADVFVDATGDGFVAYSAGVRYEKGRAEDGLMQPTTLMFTLTDVDTDNAVFCHGEECDTLVHGMRYDEYCKQAHDRGELPQNVSVVRLYEHVNEGEVLCNTSQANGIDGTNAADHIRAELELRDQMGTIIEFLRENIPGYENCRLKDSADVLGVRETRRFAGEYVLQDEDVLTGARFEDVVVHNAEFVIDIHNPSGDGQAEGLAKLSKPYDIPLRSLIPLDVDNLILSGRCISGTHRAHASYRVMKIAIPLGEAAGIAAALSVQKGILPRDLDASDVQDRLTELGVILFDQ